MTHHLYHKHITICIWCEILQNLWPKPKKQMILVILVWQNFACLIFFFFFAFFCFSYKTYPYEIMTGLAALKLWAEPCNLQACPIQASSTTQSYTSTQMTQFAKAKCISCHLHTLHHFVADSWSLAVITVFSCIDSKFHELKKDNGWA